MTSSQERLFGISAESNVIDPGEHRKAIEDLRSRSTSVKDMPGYPGRKLSDWVPVFRRMIDYSNQADLDHLVESLRLAGWK